MIIAFRSWRLGRKKKTITNLCLALSCFSSGGGTIGNWLAPFIKSVGRACGSQAGGVHVSLLQLALLCSFEIAGVIVIMVMIATIR